MAEGSATRETLPQVGKVKQVSKKWRVYEDGAMAEEIQNDEFNYKYGLNKYNRRTARGDVPVAKLVQSEEEERLQKEKFSHLERQKIIADYDQEVAKQLQQQEGKKIDDERTREDAVVACQVQTAEMIQAERERVRMEIGDQVLAARMQQQEKEKAAIRTQEREVAKTRKALQRQQSEQAGEAGMKGVRMENQERPEVSQGFRDLRVDEQADPNKVLRTDGRLEDEGDFNDFYIQPTDDMDFNEQKELQELQDEELARLLQDQEGKRGAAVDKHKLKEIEEKDAEIARLIYQQEKLKKAKREKSKELRREGKGSIEREPHVVRQVYRHETREEESSTERGGVRHVTRLEERTTHTDGVTRTHRSHHTHTEQSGRHPPHGQHSDHHPPHYHNTQPVERELPPYRHPPPITASPHRHSGGDTPPYDRPPVPPHMTGHNYAEYASRPLPDTPESLRQDSNSSYHSQSSHGHTPVSPAPPGYGGGQHPLQQPRSSSEQNGSGNMFTALDPTFQQPHSRGAPPTTSPNQRAHRQHGSRDEPRSDVNYTEHLAAQGAMGAEDPYADLNEVGPIQNQKRTSSGKKKNNCKQQ